ncbi:cell division protein FtsK [Bacillus pseudomycoides]|uniref:Cell division protein FtsK n=2 Tax=Bacillus pseudomycoides TaxID=64104 RepID=A0A2B5HB20_9BACI|nr:cell division protein FtsK [Bacillus pseudomycoides]PDY44784.1 cell division protein FtsK [Bacillus pseudomycoides]PEA85531.1 cell division protein FtsK [Bacillus pseudomycoides]PED05772.1 cell division protein FtsK [Bacillus pseudomycoides]PED69487.1 cell division protein FtsK [Bacillus pseudomycoides]PEE40821.1 cell division protein FtsK [Bacillus pseudomycoides]
MDSKVTFTMQMNGESKDATAYVSGITNLIQQRKWFVPIGQSLEKIIYHDFDETPHMAIG